MGYLFEETFESATFTTYNNTITGTPINDGAHSYNANTYLTECSLLSFINLYSPSSGTTIGGSWFPHLLALKNDLSLNGLFKLMIIAFSHDGTNYSSVISAIIRNAINWSGATNEDFSDVPIVIGNNNLYVAQHLAQIGGTAPSPLRMMCYMSGTDGRICDRFHTNMGSVPISFNNLLGGGYVSSDFASNQAFIKERILKLNTPLAVLRTEPVAGSAIRKPNDATRVVYSRPLSAIGAGADYAFSGTAVPAMVQTTATANLTPADKAENAVTLTFPAAGFDDDGMGAKTATLAIATANVHDTAGDPLTGTATFDFPVDLAGPAVVLGNSIGGRNRVKQGETVTITATFTDAHAIDATPVPRIAIADVLAATDMSPTADPFVWTYAWSVGSGNHDGKTVSILASDEYGNAALAPSGVASYTVDNTAPAAPGTPAKSTNPGWINAAEATAGVTITVALPTAASLAAAGDTLSLLLNGGPPAGKRFPLVLSAANVTAGSVAFTLSAADLGADGAKSFTASITDVAGNAGASSPALALTLDTAGPAAPVVSAASPVAPAAASWSWTAVASAVEYRIRLDLDASYTSVGTALSWSPESPESPLAAGSHTLRVQAKDAAGNWSADGSQTLVVETADPIDIVFVVDCSGSMDAHATFGAATKAKVAWVKEAVSQFATQFLPEASGSDFSAGIVLYSREYLNVLPLTPKATLSEATVTAALGGTPTRATTAMGKGMAEALRMLNYTQTEAAYGRRRAIVLLADGQQNVRPFVEPIDSNAAIPGMDAIVIDTAAHPAGCPAGMGTITLSQNRIPVHTFGIGHNVPWLATLAAVSAATGGTSLADESVWPGTLAAYVALSPALFPNTSPQLVENSTVKLGSKSFYQTTVPLNASVARLTVMANWPGDPTKNPIGISLMKGKVSVPWTSVRRTGSTFVATVAFPVQTRFGAIGPTGDWTISAASSGALPPLPAGTQFLLSVVADEKKIKYKIPDFYPVHWLHEKIPLSCELTFGQPNTAYHASTKVDVRINAFALSGAGIDIGAGHGTHGTPFRRRPVKVWNKRLKKPKKAKRGLVESNRNRFDVITASQDAYGVSSTNFVITGTDASAGTYRRVVRRDIVMFAKPDSKRSTVEWKQEGNNLVISFVPRDRDGVQIGPGLADMIKGSPDLIRIVTVDDRLDGSYIVTATLPERIGDIRQGMKVGGVSVREAIFQILVKGCLAYGPR